MLIQAVLNKQFSTKSSYVLIETKKGDDLIPAVGLEQKRMSADSPQLVWDKKECRLSSRYKFGIKRPLSESKQ